MSVAGLNGKVDAVSCALVNYGPGVREPLEALARWQPVLPVGLVAEDRDWAEAGELLDQGYVDRVVPSSDLPRHRAIHEAALSAHGERLLALRHTLAGQAGRVLLLTGATGFVGGHFLRYVLRCSEARVVVVARSTPSLSHDQRLAHLERLYPGRLRVVEGDVCLPGLGIPDRVRRELAREVDSLWHFAADTRFEPLLEELVFHTNLQGTRNVLDFARKLRTLDRIHHVSTAFVAGNHPAGQVVVEGMLDRPESFKNPYEASKFEAERAVMASGLPYTIFRPSIVMGERVSGRCDGQTVYKVAELIRLSALIARRAPVETAHRFRVVVNPDTTRNLVTVDDVVCAMLSLAAQGHLGPVHHLTNPQPAPMTDVIAVIAGLLNIPEYEAVPSLEGAVLSPFEAALQRVSGVFRPYMLNSDPHFVAGVARAWIRPVERPHLEYLLSHYFTQRHGRPFSPAFRED